MGTLRLLLALSVVAGHGDFFRPFFVMNPNAAVVSFFVISGFYMALGLNEKYTDRASFVWARARRIYPAYYFFLAVIFAVMLRGGASFDPLVVLTSLTLFGLDYLVIYGDPVGPIPIGQAWSLGVELQFYVVAALFFRTRRGISGVFLAALLIHVAINASGFLTRPFEDRLAANTLVFFGLGGLSYLFYDRIRRWPLGARALLAACAAACVLAVLHFNGNLWFEVKATDWRLYAVYIGIAALAPPLFSLTGSSKVDGFLGAMSYPIYLCHLFAFAIASKFHQGKFGVLALMAVMSVAAYIFVERPLSRSGRGGDGKRRVDIGLPKQALRDQHAGKLPVSD